MKLKRSMKFTKNWAIRKYINCVLLTCTLFMTIGVGCAMQKQCSSGSQMLSCQSDFPDGAIMVEFWDPERLDFANHRAREHLPHGAVVPPNGEKVDAMFFESYGVNPFRDTDDESILDVVKGKAQKGITLSALGFGIDNYNDVLMEKLGDRGDGHYAYIDAIAQAARLFGENLVSTLDVVARDVKIQVEFNPAVVRSYRLIGYENRDVPDERFRDDRQDGGEVGTGHSTTALYEMKLWEDKQASIATANIRYKDTDTQRFIEFKHLLNTEEVKPDFKACSPSFRLAATVTEFAEILRYSYWAQGAELSDVLTKARHLSSEYGNDTDVTELCDLISKADAIFLVNRNINDTQVEINTRPIGIDGNVLVR